MRRLLESLSTSINVPRVMPSIEDDNLLYHSESWIDPTKYLVTRHEDLPKPARRFRVTVWNNNRDLAAPGEVQGVSLVVPVYDSL